MSTITRWDGHNIKCVLTFDNNKTYTCSSLNTDDKVIISANITENTGLTSGNPLGIMSSNSININIMDKENSLVVTNDSSEYYGYMRGGVKMELYIVDKYNNETQFGVYYTDGWDTRHTNGAFNTTSLTGKNYLDYIGNMEIPELGAFSSVQISELLVEILKGIGLTTSDYYIDPELDLELTFSVTKGAKVRDTLNSIANALIARIIIDRNNIIKIVPAFPNVPVNVDNVDKNYILDAYIKNNNDSQYNRVRLDYVAVGIRASENLAKLDGYVIKPGLNTINSIIIPSKTQGIDCVYLKYKVNSQNYKNVIEYINYTGFQGGVTVEINNLHNDNIVADIIIEGKTSGVTNKSVYANVNSIRPVNIGNLLILTSDYIQSDSIATKYVNDVANYISKIEANIMFNTLLSPSIEAGTYIRVSGLQDIFNGTYYIKGITFNFNEVYSATIDAIKTV